MKYNNLIESVIREYIMENCYREMNAWHGTDAEFDDFDITFLGKGEGSNEYGKGIYVSGSKSTGEHYIEIIRGKRMTQRGNELMRRKHDTDFNDFMDNYDNEYDSIPGYLYKVEIPDDNGTNYFNYAGNMNTDYAKNIFLNYCKKGLIRNGKYSDDRFSRLTDRINRDDKWNNIRTGRDFHIALYEEGIDLSDVLASAGYIGTKVPIGYLHGMKHGKGKMNYVIFNPSNIRIVSRKNTLNNKTVKY